MTDLKEKRCVMNAHLVAQSRSDLIKLHLECVGKFGDFVASSRSKIDRACDEETKQAFMRISEKASKSHRNLRAVLERLQNVTDERLIPMLVK